jgi:hypothetical protein
VNRRGLLRGTAGVAAATALAGCSLLGGGSDVRVVSTTDDGSGGVVTVDVTVENRADGPRRAEVYATVDASSRSGTTTQTERVELAAGERRTVEFLFSNLLGGRDEALYDLETGVRDVFDPEDTAGLTEVRAADDATGAELRALYPDAPNAEPSLSEATYSNLRCGATRDAAVSPFVEADLFGDPRVAEVTLPYDPAAVPDGGAASALRVMTFDRQTQAFTARETTVDTAAGTATAEIPLEGADVVVFHLPTWEEKLAAADGEAVTTVCRANE